MDILFQEEERSEFGMGFVGLAGGVPVGHARLYIRGEHVAELAGIWLEDREGEGQAVRAFAEAFFAYLKELGYRELWLQTEDMDGGDKLGFRLEERDNAGWYPKYFSHREL